nr:hypothetical protein [Tanacetum cinerariifolium]
MEEVWRFRKVVGGRYDGRGGGGFEHLAGKSSREFKYGCGDIGRVKNMSSQGKSSSKSCGNVFVSWSDDDSLERMSMMLVQATFLGGFLVEEEALEAIFVIEQGRY